jgi:outer membrane protein assembly factor BamE
MRPRFSEPGALRRLVPASPRVLALVLGAVAASFALQGCVYRMTIQQGNFLEQRALDQLQVGMTRSQVRYLLGTPMVPDAFDKDRWDYLYYLKRGRLKSPEQRHLIVYFEDEKVARVENQGAGPS